jgi:inorganic pyrophosphatase
MPKSKGSVADPTRLLAFEDKKKDVVQVVIETPKGSRNKFAFDTKQHVFILKKVLPEGMVFPHDFGFIPSTRAQDGDPIDVLILMDEPAYPGCVVPARLVGVIEGEQTAKSIKDLNKSFLDELETFFESYHSNDGEEFKVLACKGPGAAEKCLAQAQRKIKAA